MKKNAAFSRLMCVCEPIAFVALAFACKVLPDHTDGAVCTPQSSPLILAVFMAYYIGAQAKDGDYADYEPPTRC